MDNNEDSDNSITIQVPGMHESVGDFEKWLRDVYIPVTEGDFTECWGIFSKDGHFEKYYHKSFYSVLTEEEKRDIRGKIISHNHPTGSTFSYSEVLTWADLEMTELRVVTKTHTFSLKPRHGKWPSWREIESEVIRNITPSTLEDIKQNSELRDICFQTLSSLGLFEYQKIPVDE